MTHHGACLRAELVTEGMTATQAQAVLDAVLARRVAERLSEADRTIGEFARRLTQAPAASTEVHVAALRTHGFEDRAIYDIVAITGFFGFVNRVALGLGVPLEPDWEQFLPSTLPRPVTGTE